jgi:hypothetical protein
MVLETNADGPTVLKLCSVSALSLAGQFHGKKAALKKASMSPYKDEEEEEEEEEKGEEKEEKEEDEKLRDERREPV